MKTIGMTVTTPEGVMNGRTAAMIRHVLTVTDIVIAKGLNMENSAKRFPGNLIGSGMEMSESEDFLKWWGDHAGIHNLSRYEVGEAVWMSIIHRLKLAEGERDYYKLCAENPGGLT